MFLSSRNSNVSKLNLEDRLLRCDAISVQASAYPLPAVTEVKRLITVIPTLSGIELKISRRYF